MPQNKTPEKKTKQDVLLPSNLTEIGLLLQGMQNAFKRGDNAMEHARQMLQIEKNSITATMIAYDLQSGSYIREAENHPEIRNIWCNQLADILNPFVSKYSSIMEVGCGEATTLAGVLNRLQTKPRKALGFDISWSRCHHGISWLARNQIDADLFVADLFEIPLADSSVDILYTSHSLEPNGGREHDALKELLRVARRTVVLVEPFYERASAEAQKRMEQHGYVRGLKHVAEQLGAKVVECRMLDYYTNPLNPSGLFIIQKSNEEVGSNETLGWRCPLTHSRLIINGLGCFSPDTGIAYPVLAGVPLLRAIHGVVASSFSELLTE